jgi:hypothetical protein
LIHFRVKYTLRISGILFLVIVLNGMIFNKTTAGYSHFWSMVKGDTWSNEWKQLASLLHKKEYYVPVIFYPEYNQALISDGLQVSRDIVPEKKSGFYLKDELPVHSIIVLNASGNTAKQIPVIAELYSRDVKIAQLTPYYKTNQTKRFIYFLNTQTKKTADSLVFLNDIHLPVAINTHIRIVSYKKNPVKVN